MPSGSLPDGGGVKESRLGHHKAHPAFAFPWRWVLDPDLDIAPEGACKKQQPFESETLEPTTQEI